MKARQLDSSKNTQKFTVTVLRLGHRLVRDERISTHIGLVSRAFGAKKLVLTGADDHTLDSIKRLSKQWGGEFEVSYIKNWMEFIRNWEGMKIHLTMYGEDLDAGLEKIRGKGVDLLLIIGAEKVPAEIYSVADLNIAVGNQPHSEVAALAVFLDRLFMGEELYNTFSKARLRIKPSLRSKKVEFVNEN